METIHKFILGMMLYVFVATSVVSWCAIGMGYGGIDDSAYTRAVSDSTDIAEPDDGFEIPFIGDALDTLGAGAAYFASVAGVIGSILVWTLPEQIFPFWANIALIKFPLVATIIAIVELILP